MIMGISVTYKNAKCPKGYKLASNIASYLFEEECGELRNFSDAEIEAIRKASKILAR